MKKFWLISIVLVCVFATLLCTACGGDVTPKNDADNGTEQENEQGQNGAKDGEQDAHTHTYGEWEQTLAPTCIAEGEETRTCTVEGCTEKETRSVAKVDHVDADSDGKCDVCSIGFEQLAYDAAVAQIEMDDYAFKFVTDEATLQTVREDEKDRYVLWTEELSAKKEGEADSYIVCTNQDGATDLVYLYTDISYDEGSVYRLFDMYTNVPKEQLDPATPVFLYLHGGGWIAGSRKDECLSLMPYLVQAGFVVVSMEYALWFGMNQPPFTAEEKKGVYAWHEVNVGKIIPYIFNNEHPVSVADQMKDVETCLSFLKTYLPTELGLTCRSVGIGGYSAGGHLSSLYAYKYAKQSPIELAFELDLVGPVRLLDEGYLHAVSLLLGKDEDGNAVETGSMIVDIIIEMIGDEDSNVPAMFQGVLNSDVPVDISTDEGWHLAEELIAQWQGYSFLDENSIPTIICYAKSHPESVDFLRTLNIFPDDFDLFIPITVYRSMSARLDEVGIVHADRLYEELNHNTIGSTTYSCKWMATQCRAMAQLYCR